LLIILVKELSKESTPHLQHVTIFTYSYDVFRREFVASGSS